MGLLTIVLLGLGIWIYSLSKKVDTLSRTIAQLQSNNFASATKISPVQGEGDIYKENSSDQYVAPAVNNDVNYSPHLYPNQNQKFEESFASKAIDWIKEDFMVKLGAFLLLLAFGWFVSYAFENDWIGPMGQIMLGLITGAFIMMLGIWRIEKHSHQGGIFTVLGSATIILTLFAAREIYDFFSPVSALFLMFVTVALVAFTSVKYDKVVLAWIGLIMAVLSPLFTASPEPDMIGLFNYLLVVVLGTLWVVLLRGWSVLTFTALVLVFLYSLPNLSDYYSETSTTILMYVFGFVTIFFIANIIGLIGNDKPQNRKYQIFTAIGTGLFLIVWIVNAAPSEWQSLLLVFWMLAFGLGGFLVYSASENKIPFYIYGSVSIALLAAATAIELDGSSLVIAYTIEIGLLVALVTKLINKVSLSSRLSLLFIAPILMSVESIAKRAWREGIPFGDFSVLLVLCLTLVITIMYLRESYGQEAKNILMLLVTGAAFYGLTIIWLVLHAGTSPYDVNLYDQATMYSLVIYTIIGISVYVLGKRIGNKALVIGGGILLGLVVLRLLFVEVWNMEIAGRIITFLIIGGLFISTAFMRKGHSKSNSELDNNNQNQI